MRGENFPSHYFSYNGKDTILRSARRSFELLSEEYGITTRSYFFEASTRSFLLKNFLKAAHLEKVVKRHANTSCSVASVHALVSRCGGYCCGGIRFSAC